MGFLSNLFKKSVHSLQTTTSSRFFSLSGILPAISSGIQSDKALELGYEQNVDVYSIINRISESSSIVPWIVEVQTGPDEWEKVTDTALNEIIENPNKAKGYTWTDVMYQTDVYILSTGNGMMYGITPTGFSSISQIDVLPSNHTEIKSNENWLTPEFMYKVEIGKTKFKADKEEVGHVRYFNPSYQNTDEFLWGLSPIQVAWRVVDAGNDRWEADASLLKNRGAIGLLTDKSNRPMTVGESAKAQEALDERVAGANKFGKTIVTNKDLSFVQMAMSSQDLQIIEKGIINLRTMCNVYSVDSAIFNDPDNKKFDNVSEAKKALYTEAVIPLNDRKGAVLNRWLVPNVMAGETKKFRMRPDYSGVLVLQEDFDKKSEIVTKLKLAGILTANETRTRLDIELSKDDNSDKLIISTSNALQEDIDKDTPEN